VWSPSSGSVLCELATVKKKVKRSRYRPGVAQRVGRGIALLFHDRGTRRGWAVSSTPRPHFSPGKDPVPVVQEAGWAPVSVWTGGRSRPHRDSIPNRPARSQSLYWLSYRARFLKLVYLNSCLKYMIVVNLVVWLHMLSGPCWCMSAALFGTCNFNTPFHTILLCISW